MKELWIIRHASTAWNIEKRFQGSRDIELSTEGRVEAEPWTSSFPEMDWIYSSPLQRAIQTTEIVFPNKKYIVAPELRELNLGEWEGKTQQELKVSNTEWRGLDFAPPGGESLRQVMGRVANFLSSLPQEDGRVAIVSHKMTIHAFYALATGWTAEGKPKERLRFPRLHRFFYDGKLAIDQLNESL